MVMEEVFPATDQLVIDNIINAHFTAQTPPPKKPTAMRTAMRTAMAQCRYNDIQGMVNGFFYEDPSDPLNYGFKKIQENHTVEEIAEIFTHNEGNARRLMGDGNDLPFATDEEKVG